MAKCTGDGELEHNITDFNVGECHNSGLDKGENMATTTARFGWDIPQSTDLVKNGATAISTLGTDIEDSLSVLATNTQTADYTIVLTDAWNKAVVMNKATAIALKIPTDASVAFPTGTVINVVNIGAGVCTISAVTSGTTTITSAGTTAAAPTVSQYKACSAIKLAANSWVIIGSVD